jgi:magnesium-transporting ATPase (P-type)
MKGQIMKTALSHPVRAALPTTPAHIRPIVALVSRTVLFALWQALIAALYENYASIVAAVEEGRNIYANIRKFVFYLLSCNVGEIGVLFVAIMLGWPLPLRPIHLLSHHAILNSDKPCHVICRWVTNSRHFLLPWGKL